MFYPNVETLPQFFVQVILQMKIYLVEFWDMKNDQAFKLISLLLNTLEVHFFLNEQMQLIMAVAECDLRLGLLRLRMAGDD